MVEIVVHSLLWVRKAYSNIISESRFGLKTKAVEADQSILDISLLIVAAIEDKVWSRNLSSVTIGLSGSVVQVGRLTGC
jgi:hypothetical protein